MKHIFLKIFIIIVAISLLMAQTGLGARVRARIALIHRDLFDIGSLSGAIVMESKVIRGSGHIQLYENALDALKEKKAGSRPDTVTAFKNQYKINHVSESAGEVTIDFSSRNLAGSERQERLLIAQIVATLTESFPEVDRVFFTVDGEPSATLMGHVCTAKSFSLAEAMES